MTWPTWCIAVATAFHCAALAAEEQRNRYTTPQNLKEVVQALEEIRDGYRRNQAKLVACRLRGKYQSDEADGVLDEMEFAYTRRNDRAKFELIDPDPTIGRNWLVCLTNGQSLLKFSEQNLEIYPTTLKNVTWMSLCEGLNEFTTIPSLIGEVNVDTAEYCDELLQFLQGKGKFRRYQHRVLSGQVVVSVGPALADDQAGLLKIVITSSGDPDTHEITVAPHQGYQMTSWRKTDCAADPQQWSCIKQINCKYQALSNEGWVLSYGLSTTQETGRVLKLDNKERSYSREIHVHSAEELEASTDQIDWSIKTLLSSGHFQVHDYRYVPERFVKFVPGDERLLDYIDELSFDDQ